MAIHPPGQKFRQSKLLRSKGGRREVAAVLSLTAMVDMFTVLVIFLLQNFDPTAANELLKLADKVELPKAETIKELKPAVVVTVTRENIMVNKEPVTQFSDVQAQTQWMVSPLLQKVQEAMALAKLEHEKSLKNQIQKAVVDARGQSDQIDDEPWNKVTIQSDKGIDFLTVKKVMYTVTEAGAGEINFAVTKELEQKVE